MWQLRIGRYILGTEVCLEEQGIQAPEQASQSKSSVLERDILTSSGCENQRILWLSETEGYRNHTHSFLRVLCTNLLTDKLTCSELQQGHTGRN